MDSEQDKSDQINQGPYLFDMIEKRFHILVDAFLVGRTQGNLTFNKDSRLSRQHFKIFVGPGVNMGREIHIQDLNSANGTFVQGKRIPKDQKVPLNHQDIIEAGDQILYFSFLQEMPPFTVEINRASGKPPFPQSSELSSHSNSQTQTQIIVRPARIRNIALNNLSFRRDDLGDKVPVQIVNISESGIGFVRSSAPTWPSKSSTFSGSLVINGKSTLNLELKVVRIFPDIVGCQIERSSGDFKDLLAKHFSAELAAVHLKDVSKNLPMISNWGIPHHFQGQGGCEFYYVHRDGQLCYWHVSFFGNRIEMNAAGSLKLSTGHLSKMNLNTAKKNSIPGYPDIAIKAIKFIKNIEGLSPEIQKAVCDLIQSTL